MAEGKEAGSENGSEKRKREIRDAGQRVVFVGLDLPKEVVTDALMKSLELPPLPGAKAPSKAEKDAEVQRVLKLLEDAGDLDPATGTVAVWVRVGEPVVGKDGEAPSKGDAVELAVDTPLGRQAPGRFRAPTLTHWRGEKRRIPPTAVPLQEEDVD